METFDYIWQLLAPQGEYKRRERACRRLWSGYTLEEQRAIYCIIGGKLQRGDYVSENPYFAIEDNAPKPPRRQVLTMGEYYAKYGTTEAMDGWRQENPTGQKVIYVKGG